MVRKAIEEAKVRRNYAFSIRTIENLDYLIKKGIVRNETEAIDLAIEHFTTEYRTLEKLKQEPHEPEELVVHEGKNQSRKIMGDLEECTSEPNATNAATQTGMTFIE